MEAEVVPLGALGVAVPEAEADAEAGAEALAAAGAGAGVEAIGAVEADTWRVSRSIMLGRAVLPFSQSDEVRAGSMDAAGGKMLHY